MDEATLLRCKCGDPLKANGTCGHCDVPQCPVGTDEFDHRTCGPKHNSKTCPRCEALEDWEPWPGYKKGVKEE